MSQLCPHCDEYSVPPQLTAALAEAAALRAENARLREALGNIATNNTQYTTGEGHSHAIWTARAALKEPTT